MNVQCPRNTADRVGSIYVLVVGVTMIVGTIALAVMTIGRTQLRTLTSTNDAAEARLLAFAGIEHAVACLNRTPTWRNTMESGEVEVTFNLGRGTVSWYIVDPDDDLTDDARDYIYLYGKGVVGNAVAVERVQLEPTGEPVECLASAIHANDDARNDDATITGVGIVSANDDISNSGNVYLECEAVGSISGSTYHASTDSNASSRDGPGTSVFEYYRLNGTFIDVDDLTNYSGTPYLENLVLSPANNPFGPTNPEGIYVIDCSGANLQIRWVRVVGTLVLLNAGSSTAITRTNHFAPAVTNYPALMVDGEISIDMTDYFFGPIYDLYEIGTGVNYNPAGTPYNGAEDNDIVDVYPSRIEGLVYASSNVTITDDTRIDGCLIGHDVRVEDDETLTIYYDPMYYANPPHGFSKGNELQILPGSWERQPDN